MRIHDSLRALEQRGVETHGTAENEERSVQDQGNVEDGVGQHLRCAIKYRVGERISAERTVEDLRRCQILRQWGLVCAPERLPLGTQPLAAGDALERSGLAYVYRHLGNAGHQHVSHFASRPARSLKQLAVQNDSGSYASAEREKDKIPSIFCGSIEALAESRQIDIVVDCGGDAQLLLEHRLQRNIAPSHEIGGRNHYARLCIRDPGSANANCCGRFPRYACLLQKMVDTFAYLRYDEMSVAYVCGCC